MKAEQKKAKDIINEIIAQVRNLDDRRKSTIKNTNELAKKSGLRIDWGQYKVFPANEEGGQNGSR
mgnify:CR=1 FL=1|jgi:hypothetical protein